MLAKIGLLSFFDLGGWSRRMVICLLWVSCQKSTKEKLSFHLINEIRLYFLQGLQVSRGVAVQLGKAVLFFD